MTRRFEATEEARDRFVNAALIAVAVFGFGALAASLLRAASLGWQPIVAHHIVF